MIPHHWESPGNRLIEEWPTCAKPQPSYSFSVAASTTVSLGNRRSSCLQNIPLPPYSSVSRTSSMFLSSLKTFDVGGRHVCGGQYKNTNTLGQTHCAFQLVFFLGWFHFSTSFYMMRHEFPLCMVMICVHKSSLLDLKLFKV